MVRHESLKTTGLVGILIVGLISAACNSPSIQSPTEIPSAVASPNIFPTAVQSPTVLASATIPPTQPANTPISVPTFSAQSAKDAMVKAFQNLNTAYPFRLAEDTTPIGGPPASRTTDFAVADRTHTVFISNPTIPMVTEIIRIGSQYYYLYNGNWTVNTPPGAAGALQDFAQLLINALTSVTYVGQDTVLGVPCFLFTYESTIALGNATMNGTGKAWIGISDDLPHQVDSVHTVVGVDGSSTSHLVYSYGVQLDVEAPIQ